jgi:hypothetical protein
MKVVLGFHFRGDSLREKIFERVKPIVRSLSLFSDVYDCDSGHAIYNRSASRNLVVKKALELGADVVVICDADSVPEQRPLEEAINECMVTGKLHVPFNTVKLLSPSHLNRKTIELSRLRAISSYGPSCGGVYVVRPQRWVEAGGMDERIVGWGYEDEIFLVSTTTFLGRYVSHPGNLYTFNHARRVLTDSVTTNSVLRDLYNKNIGNPTKIREIQRGSNDFT